VQAEGLGEFGDAETWGYNGISQLARRRQNPAEKD
jgi:hypothetical protein